MADPEMNLAVVGTFTDEGGLGLVSCAVDLDRIATRLSSAIPPTRSIFFAFHPSESTLVAVNEVDDGTVVSYDLDDETG